MELPRNNRTFQKGFTLIELVVVLVIIGILSAVALERFANLQQQARIAKAQGIFASVRIAAALAKSLCITDLAGLVTPSTCTAVAGTVTMDGTVVNMVNQYPAATAAGILAATQLTAATDNVTIVAGPPFLIEINGAGTLATCSVSYTAAAAAGNAPTFVLTTTGC